jgi:drug/metabolite transporter (DMT)-like permease
LPASAIWSRLIWEEVLTTQSILGMAMIVAAGLMIALGPVKD